MTMDYNRSDLCSHFSAEYIHGDRFADLADWSFNDDVNVSATKMNARDGIIFCSTHKLETLFEVLAKSSHRYLLISHNSDANVDSALYAKKPANVVHWFAQNVLIERPDLTPIPIGLERQGIVASRDIVGSMQVNIQRERPVLQKWCYLNINPDTNDAERKHVLRALRWQLHFVTTRTRRIAYPQYLQELVMHRFVVSPPGNGVDCHRTWESLYLGSIPIVKTSVCMQSFAVSGIHLVNDLSKLTRRDLRMVFEQRETTEDVRQLYFSYWKKMIAATLQRLLPGCQSPGLQS